MTVPTTPASEATTDAATERVIGLCQRLPELVDRDADLIRRGHERARSFSWTQSVRRIHDIYMEVAK